MCIDEILNQSFQILENYKFISPTLLIRKLKISHALAVKICNLLWHQEAKKRFKNHIKHAIYD
jgi:ribosomal protein S25